MFFHDHLKTMKKSSVHLWRNREDSATVFERKMCSCFSIFCEETVQLIFFTLTIVWLLLETFQCFLMNVRLLLKYISERLLLKENVQHIVLLYVEECVGASRNISMFFNERTSASEKIFNDFFWKKKNVLLRNYVHLKTN